MRTTSPTTITHSPSSLAAVALLTLGAGACSETGTFVPPEPDMAADDGGSVMLDEGIPEDAPDMADMREEAAPDLPGEMPGDEEMGCNPLPEAMVCANLCGEQPDGCGGMIDCGEPATAEEVCTTSCGDQPDGCGGKIACEPCACTDGQPRTPRCGPCDLGVSTCEGDTFTCEQRVIPGLDEVADCEAALVYLDVRHDGEGQGTRQAPHTTYAAALQAAQAQGARAILVAGNENTVYPEALEVVDGVSVLGGWDRNWAPAPTRTPAFELPAPISAEDVFGARAIDVTDFDTRVAYLQVRTPDALPSPDGPGPSNYGFYARNAGMLTLDHVTVEAGAGGKGADGEDGMDGAANGEPGQDGLHTPRTYFIHTTLNDLFSHGVPGGQNTSCDLTRGNPNGGAGGRGYIDDINYGEDGEDSPGGAKGGEAGPSPFLPMEKMEHLAS